MSDDAAEELQRLRARAESLEERLQELRAADEYLDAILMNLPVGVAILEGEDFRYSRINQVLADLNGVRVDDHIGRTVSEILPHAELIEENLRSVRETGNAILNREFTVSLPSSPDKAVHLEDSHFPIRVDGVVKAVGAVVWDVSARKEADDLRKKLVGEILRAQEETMARVARELHDGIAQDLAALIYLADGFDRLMGCLADTSTAADLIESGTVLIQGLQKAVLEVRRISTDLAPLDLELGLESAISNHIKMLCAATGARIHLDSSISDAELSKDIELTLYRIIQESLSNALRHGRPDSIRVVIARAEGNVGLQVIDDGSGIDLENPRSGMGMRSMRERAELVGGTFSVRTGSEGTAIAVSIPAPSTSTA